VSTSITDLQSQVSHLQAETTKLINQLSQYESQAQNESRAREQAEHQIRRLENELTSTQTERDNLRQETTQLFSINERLAKTMDQRDREVKKALSAIYRSGDPL
jgi:chromosome segregation ATPase